MSGIPISARAAPLAKRRVLRRRNCALKIEPSTGMTSAKGSNIAAVALKICFGLGASLWAARRHIVLFDVVRDIAEFIEKSLYFF